MASSRATVIATGKVITVDNEFTSAGEAVIQGAQSVGGAALLAWAEDDGSWPTEQA